VAWHTVYMDAIPQQHMPGADEQLAEAARTVHRQLPTFAQLLSEFGEQYQIETTAECVVAVRRPTPTAQEITTGRSAEEVLGKLRAERDGTDAA
jgi:hypothetical protein